MDYISLLNLGQAKNLTVPDYFFTKPLTRPGQKALDRCLPDDYPAQYRLHGNNGSNSTENGSSVATTSTADSGPRIRQIIKRVPIARPKGPVNKSPWCRPTKRRWKKVIVWVDERGNEVPDPNNPSKDQSDHERARSPSPKLNGSVHSDEDSDEEKDTSISRSLRSRRNSKSPRGRSPSPRRGSSSPASKKGSPKERKSRSRSRSRSKSPDRKRSRSPVRSPNRSPGRSPNRSRSPVQSPNRRSPSPASRSPRSKSRRSPSPSTSKSPTKDSSPKKVSAFFLCLIKQRHCIHFSLFSSSECIALCKFRSYINSFSQDVHQHPRSLQYHCLRLKETTL